MYARYRSKPGRIILPDVCCDLVWAREKLTLTGPSTRGQLSSLVGEDIQLLNLDPLTARLWVGIPLEHLTDQSIPLDAIDREVAARLAELFFNGHAGLLVRPVDQQSGDRRMAVAAAALRRVHSVKTAATIADLSPRQLERLFKDSYGMSPKEYVRILRFRRAMRSVGEGGTLADAAAASGYADQSHFTREARSLMGQNPRAFLPNVANVQDVIRNTRPY
jgi:AraC-like DNA-binding protein